MVPTADKIVVPALGSKSASVLANPPEIKYFPFPLDVKELGVSTALPPILTADI